MLISLRVWTRSTVVMLGILLMAVYVSALLTRRWRPAAAYTLCVVAGILIGALMTGTPVEFLSYNIKHFYWTLFRDDGPRFVVRELGPFDGNPNILLLFLGYLGVRAASGRMPRRGSRTPSAAPGRSRRCTGRTRHGSRGTTACCTRRR